MEPALSSSGRSGYLPAPAAKVMAERVGFVDTYDMNQILYSGTPIQVMTNATAFIDFTFCPTSDSYELDVIVVAIDEISAFQTYVCTNFSATNPCNAYNGQNNADPSGRAVNHVRLTTNYRQFTSMEVAVLGFGNLNQNNKFLFSVMQPLQS